MKTESHMPEPDAMNSGAGTEETEAAGTVSGVRRIAVHIARLDAWEPTLDQMLDHGNSGDGEVRVSSERLARARRFLRREDGYRSILAELLMLRTLREYTGEAIGADRIGTDEKGKPFVPGMRNVHFNLTHSGNLVMCAADSYPIGVDVEAIRDIDPDVATSCFTVRERGTLPPDSERERFTESFHTLWTLKESYLKALGTGLSRDPLSVEIYPSDGPDGVWRVEGDDRFNLHEVRSDDGYRTAVCAERGVAVPGALVELERQYFSTR